MRYSSEVVAGPWLGQAERKDSFLRMSVVKTAPLWLHSLLNAPRAAALHSEMVAAGPLTLYLVYFTLCVCVHMCVRTCVCERMQILACTNAYGG